MPEEPMSEPEEELSNQEERPPHREEPPFRPEERFSATEERLTKMEEWRAVLEERHRNPRQRQASGESSRKLRQRRKLAGLGKKILRRGCDTSGRWLSMRLPTIPGCSWGDAMTLLTITAGVNTF